MGNPVQQGSCHLAVIEDLWLFFGEKDPDREDLAGEGEKEGKRATRKLSPEEKERIEKEIGHLRDQEMKRILFRLFAKSLALGKSKI